MDLIFDLDLDEISESQTEILLDKTKEITKIISQEQLKTQSKITSIYGCNLDGFHQEITSENNKSEDLFGKQLILKRNKINIQGPNIGGLVLANINKDPPEKKGKQYKTNPFHNVEIYIDSRITNLVITNCKNLTLRLTHNIKVSIEIIQSSDITLYTFGFPFFRSMYCGPINIIGNIRPNIIFDIRKSLSIHINRLDVYFNPHLENRYKYSEGILIRVPDEEDIFLGSPKSFPDLTLAKIYKT